MPISRLRLRIASGFAVAFALALALLAAGSLGYLWRESNRRLDVRLTGVVDEVRRSLVRELGETPDSSLHYVASEVAAEWPRNGDAFAILDDRDSIVAAVSTDVLARRVVAAWRAGRESRFTVDHDDPDLHTVVQRMTVAADSAHAWNVTVLTFASTEGIESDTELLGVALAIAAPLIILLSLVAGYMLARRALKPVTDLGNAMAGVAPTDLSTRLDVAEPRDEISALASEFNSLLARLNEAQVRNRGFVREAAHQIRTPLTLVLGEAAHELASSDGSPEKMRATLNRIRSAAEQMRRRVDELFLLAEAQSGEPLRLDSVVELDGLILEATDMMRARATALGRALAIGRADPIVIQGNEPLLKEAVVELVENACKHGTADSPITVSAFADAQHAFIDVVSTGARFTLPEGALEQGRPNGIGLPIVQWVAQSHHGTLSVYHDDSATSATNRMRMSFPKH